MYDVDGNGVIDIQEMTKIVQVQTSIDMIGTITKRYLIDLTIKTFMYLFKFCFYLYFNGGYLKNVFKIY